jgi:Cof subfamily protein (haloacid dehalogenase superfamily)
MTTPVRPPRLVATDLDGTIVRRDGTVSDRVVAALDRVRDAGAELVVVTGRPPRWIPAVAERIGHGGLAICANGALVVDLADGSVVERYPLEAATVTDLVSRLREAIPDASFAVEDDAGMRHEAGFPADEELDRPGVRLVEAAALAELPVTKLLVRDPSGDPDALLARAVEIAGGLAELTHSSTTAMVEISATGVTKASTLAALCERRGITAEEVVAFGDMPNDLPMLAWAGTAYAVANAHPTVLQAVQLVAPSVDQDGVAQVLERMFGRTRWG